MHLVSARESSTKNHKIIFSQHKAKGLKSQKLSSNKSLIKSLFLQQILSISIFPQKLTFLQIYPNAISQKKILIPNSWMPQEVFDVSITKGTQFSIPITELSIDPGQTYATIVTCIPKEIGSCNAMLLFSGNVQLGVPLSGTCVASPLEILPLSSDQWIFTSK